MVHLLLEKGQPQASREHIPVTLQCTLPDQNPQGQASEKVVQKATPGKDYGFVTEGQAWETLVWHCELLLHYSKYNFYL